MSLYKNSMMIFSLFLMYDNFKFIIVFNNQELFNKERNLFIKWILKKNRQTKQKQMQIQLFAKAWPSQKHRSNIKREN